MSGDDLAERIRSTLPPQGISERRMFGGTCFLLKDHMVAGTSKRGLLVRVGKDNHAAFVSRQHARVMEMNGRKMEGYIYVAPEGITTDGALREWLDIACSYVGTLPPKGAKTAAKRRR
jgi:TfoX/Sxy family transcriptional regulator of competence genes